MGESKELQYFDYVKYDSVALNGFVKVMKECSRYDTKQFDGEVIIMLELWGIWNTPSLPLLWPRVVAPHRVLCDMTLNNLMVKL